MTDIKIAKYLDEFVSRPRYNQRRSPIWKVLRNAGLIVNLDRGKDVQVIMTERGYRQVRMASGKLKWVKEETGEEYVALT